MKTEKVVETAKKIANNLDGVSPTGALDRVGKGAAIGIAAVTALPVFGAVGTITAAGLVVGASVGALAGVAEELMKARKSRPYDGQGE